MRVLFPCGALAEEVHQKKRKKGGATVMRVSAAGIKPWKPAAMKTIPKLCSSGRSLVAAVWPSGQLRTRACHQLTGVFVSREISVKKHGGRLRNVVISLKMNSAEDDGIN